MPDARPASTPPLLLVIDDDPGVLPIVERFAEQLGFDVMCLTSGREAISSLDDILPDVVLVDLQMPELSGIDVLKSVRASQPDCHVILMTGNATVETAIEAVKEGALDYLTKPFDFARLEALLVGIRDARARRADLMRVDADLADRVEFQGMIGRGPGMQQLFESIQRLAPHARTVLITGETGTGKELVAKALHRCGRRRDKKLITLNCSAVVETLFESELFGHVRGAFTGATDTKVGLFEHASGGTLFLDEAGELPLSLQAKLLRAVENGEIQRVGSLETRRADVSVIAATNRDLREEAAAGRFRSDLYYRLGIIEIHVPPLRDRREDIPYLTASFIRDIARGLDRPINGMTASAERILQQAAWPGNVRELRNVIERACLLANGAILTERDISSAMAPAATPMTAAEAPSMPAVPEAPPGPGDRTLLSTAQREQIRRVLIEANGNKTEAARMLGISRRSLYRWVDRLGLKA